MKTPRLSRPGRRFSASPVALPPPWRDLQSQQALGQQRSPSPLYRTRGVFLGSFHGFAFEFHPLVAVSVTGAERMLSFHLFVRHSPGVGALGPMRAEETGVWCTGTVLGFCSFSSTRVAAVAAWGHTVERVSRCGCLCDDWGTTQTALSCLADSLGHSASVLCCCDMCPSRVWVTPCTPVLLCRFLPLPDSCASPRHGVAAA